LRDSSFRVREPFLTLYTMDAHLIIPRLIAALLSLLDMANLRNRVYTLEQRVSQLELAIEDIERINANATSPNPLIKGIIHNSRNL